MTINFEQMKQEIQAMIAERDLRFYDFYAGYVLTLGSESAGEKIRRIATAEKSAAQFSVEDAAGMGAALEMALPYLDAESIDGKRAISQIHRALRFCPEAGR